MKYIVMECHYSYAIVMDENGRFLKAANLHYEVGQTITDVIYMQEPEHAPLNQEDNSFSKKRSKHWISHIGTIAACLVLIFTFLFQMDHTAYGSVFVTINPEVRIDVNKKDIVVGMEGVNEDGKELIKNYSYKKKNLDLVMDDLVDLAIEKQYLADGGQISLSFSGEHQDWITDHSTHLNEHLNEYLKEKMTITIEIDEDEIEVSMDDDDDINGDDDDINDNDDDDDEDEDD